MSNNKQKVLLTGLTSFTGCYIAKAFLEDGYEVICPLRKDIESYEGIKQKRIEFAQAKNNGVQIVENLDISSGEFIDFVEQLKPDIFINHGGYITNYRSDEFDFMMHLKTNLLNIEALTKSLVNNNCKFIHSGSAFEPGEEYTQFGVSVYGVAKKMVWDMTAYWCNKYKISTSKIVIPNPYGYLENQDRLLPIFANKLLNAENVVLHNSETVRNNINAIELAKYYVQEAKNKKQEINIVKPTGYTETQKAFVQRALKEEPYNLPQNLINKHIQFTK